MGLAFFRFDIEGSLSGEAVKEVELSWCTASSVIGGRALVVAFGQVTGIDALGRGILRGWSDAGPQFVARSSLAKTLVGSMIGQPVTSGVAAAKCNGWGRFRAYTLPLILLVALFSPATANAAMLEPATSKAWEAYVESAAARMEQRLLPGKPFLWVNEAPDRAGKGSGR
jgi:hypothetical protein